IFYFFFQAEDGIRDFHVTGVQTCALPISAAISSNSLSLIPYALMAVTSGFPFVNVPVLSNTMAFNFAIFSITSPPLIKIPLRARSEERRVGKECRSGW